MPHILQDIFSGQILYPSLNNLQGFPAAYRWATEPLRHPWKISPQKKAQVHGHFRRLTYLWEPMCELSA